jgi:hypothetical protein
VVSESACRSRGSGVGVFKIGSDQADRQIEDPDVDHCRCGPGARWCARADALFDVERMHVVDVRRGHRRLVTTVETDAEVAGCSGCGVLAVGHGGASIALPTRRALVSWSWCGSSSESGAAPSRRAR